MDTKPWLSHYPAETPPQIDPDKYNSLVSLFQDCVRQYSDHVALVNMTEEITFQELDKLSDNFAAYLQHKTTLQPGDRVAIQMPNLLQYPVALMGILKAGMVAVNTNPLYTPREMKHQFTDSGAKGIVILANYAKNLESIVTQTSIDTIIITQVGDMLGEIRGTLINLGVRIFKHMVPDYDLPQSIEFKKVLQGGEKLNLNEVTQTNDQLALLQYTGGTTGVAKGVALTHRNLIANILQAHAWMLPKLVNKEEVVITALPLYHVFAFTVNLFSMMCIGATNVLITDPRDIKLLIRTFKQHPFSVFTGVNTLFNALINRKEFAKLDFSHLKVTVGGAMAVQTAVANRWKEITGTSLVEGYGLSETSPLLTCNPINGNEKQGTIGLPVPNTLILIADDEGHPVPIGERGEILAQGPQVMSGYWQKEEENKQVFVNGWLRTGDVGIMDEEGYIKIVDRKKDMINVSGFKVFPNEVEDVLTHHPKVLEAGVIGVPDKQSNEVVTAFVVKSDESLTEKELMAYCHENITAYKRPKTIIFVDELPKSNIGKVLRRELREQIADS